MHASPPATAGISDVINAAFIDGFPDDWKEYLSKDGRKRGSPNAGASRDGRA